MPRSESRVASRVPLSLPFWVAACPAALSLLVLSLMVAAPLAAHRDAWFTPLLYAVFDPVCHQLPERSFHLWNEPLGVCHRCAGLYLGFALGIAIWPGFPAAARRLSTRPRLILVFSIPLAVDAIVLSNTAMTRFGTGMIAAFPAALLALAAADQLVDRAKMRPPLLWEEGRAAPGGRR